jgi:integrase
MRGVYRTKHGWRICWRDRGRQQQKNFPPDTPLEVLKGWRRRKVGQSKPSTDKRKAGLARDVVQYLRTRKHLTSYITERAQLRAWVHRYPRLSRWALTAMHIREAVADWQSLGYSAQEIRHRVRALRRVFRYLDGPREPTPCDDVTLPKLPRRQRVITEEDIRRTDDLIRQVAVRLRAAEIAGKLRDQKTRARYLVMATTGQRPAQIRRAKPEDISLDQRLWIVRPAKGDYGSLVWLNDDMLAAWQLFISAKAWGHFNKRSFARVLHSNGWPKGIRPYGMRSAVGVAMNASGVPLEDVAALFGHTSQKTTRTFYVPALLARLAAASQAIEGRIGPAAIAPTGASQSQPAKGEPLNSASTPQAPPGESRPLQANSGTLPTGRNAARNSHKLAKFA